MMRKFLLIAVTITVGLTTPLSAQFLGHLRSARTSGLGSLNLQSAVGMYEDAFTLMGRARYGVASQMDMTASLALLDLENTDNLDIVLGSDLLYQVSHYDLGHALDMSLGGFLEYYSSDRPHNHDYSNLAVGMELVASRPLDLSTRFSITPYGKLNVRINRYEVNGNDDSDFNIGLNVGAVVPLSGFVDLTGEAQFDDQFGFVVGLNFLMW